MTYTHHFITGATLIIAVLFHMSNGVNCKAKRDALFVFGDSFVDTGNTRLPAESWMVPYGVTYPGQPTGRWSDGRVWSDYVARHLGLKSPIPYEQRAKHQKRLKNGVNFAYGGSGLFQTLYPVPNMTQQIDNFEMMIRDKVFTRKTLGSSVAIFAVSGNDYTKFAVVDNPKATPQDWKHFISRLINQMIVNIKRIQGMGIKTITINGISPLGCFPSVTKRSNYTECDKLSNELSEFHNNVLKEEISKMNETAPAEYLFMDLYNAFLAAIRKRDKVLAGNRLMSCCRSFGEPFKCGSVDENGTKYYMVCNNTKSYFYWDQEHPTQQGWKDVYLILRSTLPQL